MARRSFIVSMTYELSEETSPKAARLLRAELVGRRWHDRVRERRMPDTAVWSERPVDDETTATVLHERCARELGACAERVRTAGLPLRIARAWIQVAGGGSYGLADLSML